MTASKIVLSVFAFFVSVGALGDTSPIVRVKLAQFSFPMEISGTSITFKGIKPTSLKNVAIPKEEKYEIDFKTIKGKNIWFIRKNNNVTRVSEKYLEINALDPKINISGYSIPSPTLLGPGGEVVTALPLESYLEGVIAGEMPVSWPMEALKSQVVAARSYTLFQMEVRKKQLFHLEASILDQMFIDPNGETQVARIRQAVSETRGQILTQQGHVIKAYYHADCGGQTEDPAYVWGGEIPKHLQSAVDEPCAFNPQNKWSVEIPLEELRQKLESLRPELGELESARVVSRTPTGRALLLAFNDDSKTPIMISGNELRRLVGFTKIKSTLFTLEQKDDTLIFTGKGSGHGSGLCQNGARFLAEKGSTVREILKHYYPAAQLSSVDVAHR